MVQRLTSTQYYAREIPVAQLIADPISHLGYFTEWGGRPWERLVNIGIVGYLGTDLSGLHILDFGARYGRMSCLFALLGARVTALDLHADCLQQAQDEAGKLGVTDRITFLRYDGDLDNLPERSFDVVFSKSVLVLVENRVRSIQGLRRALKDDGRFVFVENGLGNAALRLARRIKHYGKWDYSEASFLAASDIDFMCTEFNIERMSRSWIPPIYLLCGTNLRQSENDGVVIIPRRLSLSGTRPAPELP